MRRKLRLAQPAKNDLEGIWSHTARSFDVEQADAYESLLWQAIRDIRDEPERPASRKRGDLGTQVRSFHIDLSKGRSDSGVKSPRHVIFYTLQFENEVRVLRILHEKMRPERYLK